MSKDVNVEEAKRVQREVSNFVNKFSCDYDAFIKAMGDDHRTLQQSFTRLCFKWIWHNAGLLPYMCDLRNEYSVTKCKEIVEKVHLDMPPFI